MIPAFACILVYRGSSKRTSRHSRAQVPAVFSAVRPLFQPGLDSPRIKNTDRFTTPTFVHSCPSLDAVYYTLVFFLLSLFRRTFPIFEREIFEIFVFSKRLKMKRSREDSFNYGSIYQAKKNLHRLTLPSTFPFLAPLDAGPVPGTSRCNRLAVSHEVQVDVVPVRAAKALRAC